MQNDKCAQRDACTKPQKQRTSPRGDAPIRHLLYIAVQAPHGDLTAAQRVHRAVPAAHHKAVLPVDIQGRHRLPGVRDAQRLPQIQAQAAIIGGVDRRGVQVSEGLAQSLCQGRFQGSPVCGIALGLQGRGDPGHLRRKVIGPLPQVDADADVPDVIKNILVPINAQKGDDLPVSAFRGMEDGTMPLGTSQYEKRGIATHLPVWDKSECIQCNRCSFVCPHAVIRPYLLNEDEVKNAPAGLELTDAKGPQLAGLRYTMGVSTLDCTSCGSCVASCPKSGKALKMVPAHEVSLDQTDWNFLTGVKEKTSRVDKFTLKGSQFKQPLVEFNGACAGCGETPYIKLLTQMFGDKMYLANATGCTQAWGAAMPCVPYCKNAEGKGVAWSNSLFENNAEFSYGMCLAVKQLRDCVTGYVKELDALTKDEAVKAAIAKWLETYDDLDASTPATEELVKLLESGKFSAEEQKLVDEILKRRKDLSKKTMWMYGGDGWAYDIGYGGLDHVFAMGEDVNVLLVDTEVYSNTGGQSSKATPVGAVAQFQASGKKTKKKDLGMLMMTYDNVYVAQCSMGANPNQLIKAIKEAEAHKGPSIVICYAPCINHGIKKGMNNVQQEMKDAVNSGYWNLYRYSPETKTFTLDSKEPTMPLYDFMKGEVRYASLELSFPENAKVLFAEAEEAAKEKYESYKRRAEK